MVESKSVNTRTDRGIFPLLPILKMANHLTMESSPHTTITSLVHDIADVLVERGWTLSTAESCTGGGIGFELTAVSGSSRWYEGGVISYSNNVKSQQLHVPEVLLSKYGAVSEPVAEAMAQGVRKLLRTDLAVAVTGIAGPDGGTPDKPVGTVWIAWSTGQSTEARHFHFSGDREQVRRQTVVEALQGVLAVIS